MYIDDVNRVLVLGFSVLAGWNFGVFVTEVVQENGIAALFGPAGAQIAGEILERYAVSANMAVSLKYLYNTKVSSSANLPARVRSVNEPGQGSMRNSRLPWPNPLKS